jgi:predicted small secreted protein
MGAWLFNKHELIEKRASLTLLVQLPGGTVEIKAQRDPSSTTTPNNKESSAAVPSSTLTTGSGAMRGMGGDIRVQGQGVPVRAMAGMTHEMLVAHPGGLSRTSASLPIQSPPQGKDGQRR